MSTKRRRQLVESDSSSDEEDTFTFRYGEDLYENDEDRERIESMPEVEMMRILAERSEERNEAMEIWRMQLANEKKEKKAAKEAAEPERKARRRDTSKKSQRDKAMEQLKAKRKKNQAREAKARVASDDEDDADDDDRDIQDDNEDDYREGTPDVMENFGDSDEDVESVVAELSDIQRIRLSRHRLEKWCHQPFFNDTVEGCFVRIGIGKNDSGTYMYRAAQIVGVVIRQASYNLGKTRTKKGLLLKHGTQERQFRMEYVSNAPITDSEFTKWRDQMEDNNLNLIKKDFVDRKAKKLEESSNFNHSIKTILDGVKEKREAGSGGGNSAILRAGLLKKIKTAELEAADLATKLQEADEENEEEIERLGKERDNALDEAEKVREEIDRDKQKATEQYNVRAQHFLSIEEINVRNDQLNRIKAAAMAADGSGGGKKVRTLYDRRPNAPSIVSVKKRMKGAAGAVPDSKKADPKSPAKPEESEDPKSPLSPTSPTLPDTAGGGLELDLDLDMELPDEILGDAPASLKSSNPRPTSKAPSSAYGQSLYKYKLANGLL